MNANIINEQELWIKCSPKNMPKAGIDVLIYIHTSDYSGITVASWWSLANHWYISYAAIYTTIEPKYVSHWMPNPNPPSNLKKFKKEIVPWF